MTAAGREQNGCYRVPQRVKTDPASVRFLGGNRPDAQLPVLEIDIGLWEPCYFPRLSTAAIPIDLRMTKCDETQRKVAAIEALRVPPDRNDRPIKIAAGQFAHLAAQTILRLVGEAAT